MGNQNIRCRLGQTQHDKRVIGALLTLGDTAAEATLETTATFDKLHVWAHICLTAITADGTTFSMIHKIWWCLPVKRNDMPLLTNSFVIILKGKQKHVVVHTHRMWPFTSSGGRGARGLMTAARGTWDCLAMSELQGML